MHKNKRACAPDLIFDPTLAGWHLNTTNYRRLRQNHACFVQRFVQFKGSFSSRCLQIVSIRPTF